MYKDFLIILIIVLIHEMGHAIMAIIFKWKLDSISIYPFGGCVKFNEDINKPMYQELLILISGPVIQIILYLLVLTLFNNNLISLRNFNIFKSYHYTLLIFNLIPIYPLDGGHLFNILTNYLFPYKKGNKLVIIISIILTIILIIYIKNINFILMGMLLIIEIYLYYKRQDYLYNKFLLERYLNKYNFKKLKIIKNKDDMYKGKRHVLKNSNKYLTEKEYLNKRFKEVKWKN